jgi:hypothetical protein
VKKNLKPYVYKQSKGYAPSIEIQNSKPKIQNNIFGFGLFLGFCGRGMPDVVPVEE